VNVKCKRFPKRTLSFFLGSSKPRPLFKDRTEVNFTVNESVLKQLDGNEHLAFKPRTLRTLGARNRVMI
jgi:hypothetical protein